MDKILYPNNPVRCIAQGQARMWKISNSNKFNLKYY